MSPTTPALGSAPRKPLVLALPAILLTLLVLLPFLNKAFTIDDTLLLLEARQILQDPLRPGSFDVVWDLEAPVHASDAVLITGPVGGYLLAPAVALGGSEPVAHLVWILLLGCAAIATASLARRLGYSDPESALAAVLLVSAPAVLGMAGTNMPDVPAMAFGVMAVERFLAWRSAHKLHQAAAASILFTLAMLSRGQLLLLLPVVAVVPLLERWAPSPGSPQPRAARLWWIPLLGALLCVAVVQWLVLESGAAEPEQVGAMRSLTNWRQVPGHLISFAGHWVLVFPLGIGWLLVEGRRLRWWLAAATLVALVAPLPQSAPRWTAPVAALGGLVILDILAECLRRRDSMRLSLGLWLLLGLATVPYLHHPAKYSVPAAPAAALLLAPEIMRSGRRYRIGVSAVCIGAGVTLGVLILRADAALAGIGRQAATEFIRPAVDAGTNVWFTGHWGFQWYAQQSGARPVTRTGAAPQPGDLIVSSTIDQSFALDYVPRRRLERALVFDNPGGRVMSRPIRLASFLTGGAICRGPGGRERSIA